MKQTAVDWFFKALIENQDKTYKQIELILEQAKAMEKEQLIMFGAQCMVEVEKESGVGAIKIYELYFDKTFKS